jgi:large subunit ribosomal protein L29
VKASELRELTVDELEDKVRDLSDQIFRMRLQKSLGQLEAAHKVQATRRDLARVKTILRQKGRPRAAG